MRHPVWLLLFALLGFPAFAAIPVPTPDPATVASLVKVPGSVEVVLYYSGGSEAGKLVRAYFDALAAKAPGRISVRLLDVALDASAAGELGIDENGVIVLRANGRVVTQRVGHEGEVAMLDAFTRSRLDQLGRTRVDVGIQGRFEELAGLRRTFEEGGARVVEVKGGEIPETVALLVVAGPIPKKDVRAIGAWLDTGGRLLLLPVADDAGTVALAAKLGVRFGPGPVREGRPSPTQLLRVQYLPPFEPRKGDAIALVLPDAVSLPTLPDGALVLARTSEKAWVDADRDGEADADETRGPVPVAAGVSGEGKKGQSWRALVFGSDAVFDDIALERALGNGLALRESVAWVVDDDAPEPPVGADPETLPMDAPIPLYGDGGPVDRLTLRSGGAEHVIERRSDAHGPYTWVTGPRGGFLGGGSATRLLDEPPVAVREIDPASELDPETSGLDVPEMVVVAGDVEVVLGGGAIGMDERFARRGGRLFLVDSRNVNRLIRPRGLGDSRLVPASEYGYEGIVVTSSGKETRIFRDEAKLTVEQGKWVKLALGLDGFSIEKPYGTLVSMLSYTVFVKGERWNVEILREESGKRWFARSDWRRALVQVSGSVASVAAF